MSKRFILVELAVDIWAVVGEPGLTVQRGGRGWHLVADRQPLVGPFVSLASVLRFVREIVGDAEIGTPLQ